MGKTLGKNKLKGTSPYRVLRMPQKILPSSCKKTQSHAKASTILGDGRVRSKTVPKRSLFRYEGTRRYFQTHKCLQLYLPCLFLGDSLRKCYIKIRG